jgi:hypothetical protein
MASSIGTPLERNHYAMPDRSRSPESESRDRVPPSNRSPSPIPEVRRESSLRGDFFDHDVVAPPDHRLALRRDFYSSPPPSEGGSDQHPIPISVSGRASSWTASENSYRPRSVQAAAPAAFSDYRDSVCILDVALGNTTIDHSLSTIFIIVKPTSIIPQAITEQFAAIRCR